MRKFLLLPGFLFALLSPILIFGGLVSFMGDPNPGESKESRSQNARSLAVISTFCVIGGICSVGASVACFMLATKERPSEEQP